MGFAELNLLCKEAVLFLEEKHIIKLFEEDEYRLCVWLCVLLEEEEEEEMKEGNKKYGRPSQTPFSMGSPF